jgi:hypothetical protein
VLPCLQVDPSECKVLLTDPALNPLANRQRMLGVMFETYGFEAAFMQVWSSSLLTGSAESNHVLCAAAMQVCTLLLPVRLPVQLAAHMPERPQPLAPALRRQESHHTACPCPAGAGSADAVCAGPAHWAGHRLRRRRLTCGASSCLHHVDTV